MSPQNIFFDKVQKYEPMMVFGRGENFFPADIGKYVSHCSMHTWIGGPNHVMRVPPGELHLENLYRWDNIKNFMVYADEQFWDAPLIAQLNRLKNRAGSYVDIPFDELIRHVMDRGYQGNMEQPLLKRIVKLNSLLDFAGIATRGDLPDKIFAQALKNYGGLDVDPPTYYFHVFDKTINKGRFDVIQYWFFYAFNDWAQSHKGVNDHEADWESVFVYFDDIRSDKPPYGMVYSAHSDQLFRPWSAVKRQGDHPLVHVAPGSHASYPPSNIENVIRASLWRPFAAGRQLYYRVVESWHKNGVVIGGKDGRPWVGRHDLLAPENDPWVERYKGLYGARYLVDMPLRPRQKDKPGGSPGGPKYEPTGEVRLKWRDPVGWARL